METLEITVGQNQRGLRLEPQPQADTFKIFASDPTQDWLDYERPEQVDLPEDGCQGQITVRGETDFDFEGAGAFTGPELQNIAGQVSWYLRKKVER
jgi:hypothetical protein